MRPALAAAFGFCLLSGTVLAQTPPPPAPPAEPSAGAAAPTDDKQLICVGQDPAASTRVHARRVCRTLEEWNKRGGVPK